MLYYNLIKIDKLGGYEYPIKKKRWVWIDR